MRSPCVWRRMRVVWRSQMSFSRTRLLQAATPRDKAERWASHRSQTPSSTCPPSRPVHRSLLAEPERRFRGANAPLHLQRGEAFA